MMAAVWMLIRSDPGMSTTRSLIHFLWILYKGEFGLSPYLIRRTLSETLLAFLGHLADNSLAC